MLKLIPDNPSEQGRFNFEVYGRLIAEAIQTHESKEALVIGVHGRWGSGKTTLLKMVEKQLLSNDSNEVLEPNQSKCIIVQFNPWRFTKEESLWRALILTIVAKLKQEVEDGYFGTEKDQAEEAKQRLEETEKALYTAFVREEKGDIEFNYAGAAQEGLKLALRFTPWGEIGSWAEKIFVKKDQDGNAEQETLTEQDIESVWNLFKRDVVRSEIQKIQSIEQFLDAFKHLIEIFLDNPNNSDNNQKNRLVVFIDDLDRCLPDKAIDIFEAIKLFLDFQRCTYLVAIDREVIQKGLDIRYQQNNSTREAISGDNYIEKMMALSFSIPPLSTNNAVDFLETMEAASIEERFREIVLKGVSLNLRKLKRFANMLAFQLAAYRELNPYSEGSDSVSKKAKNLEEQFVKLQCIAFTWKGFFGIVSQFPQILVPLEKICVQVIGKLNQGAIEQENQDSEALINMIKRADNAQDQLFTKYPQLEEELKKDVRLIYFLDSRPRFGQEFEDGKRVLDLLNHIILE